MATSYYQTPNFETILHLVETALSMPSGASWLATSDDRKPAFGAFANIMPHWVPILEERQALREFGEAMLNVVADELVTRTEALATDALTRAGALIAALAEQFHLVIVTLNYDDLLERCFPRYTDGFADDEVASFVPSRLLNGSPDIPELIHLHGSVRFAVRTAAGVIEILRCPSAARAQEVGRWSLAVGTQAGEEVYVGPMVSGYRKSRYVDVRNLAASRAYHITCKVRTIIPNTTSLQNLQPAIITAYSGYPVMLVNAVQFNSGASASQTAAPYLVDYFPKTLNSSVNTSESAAQGTSSSSNSQYSTGSSTSETNTYDVSVNLGFFGADPTGGVTGSYGNSTTNTREQSQSEGTARVSVTV
jgi:hypothetical protein